MPTTVELPEIAYKRKLIDHIERRFRGDDFTPKSWPRLKRMQEQLLRDLMGSPETYPRSSRRKEIK